jgi:hypothetical protein
LRLGTAMSEISRKLGIDDADLEALDQARNKKPAEPFRLR